MRESTKVYVTINWVQNGVEEKILPINSEGKAVEKSPPGHYKYVRYLSEGSEYFLTEGEAINYVEGQKAEYASILLKALSRLGK